MQMNALRAKLPRRIINLFLRSRPIRSLTFSLFTCLLIFSGGCGKTTSQNSAPVSSPSVSSIATPSSSATLSNSPTTSSSATSSSLKFKQTDGNTAFSLNILPDGAKLVDAADRELARLTRDDQQKIKIKNASDQTLAYVVPAADHWKLENANQTEELYILRRQNDGDYKLEDAADREIYRIKQRDYGFEIETPTKQSLYKIKVKDGKVSLRDASDQTILSTRSPLPPIAMACFGFEVLSREQQAGLAYALYE